MKKIKYLLILISISAGLLGCAQLFEVNVFSSLDHAKVPSVDELSKMATGEALDMLEEEAGSDRFFDDLKSDEKAKSELKEYLKDKWDSGSAEDTENKQRAALLYADIELKTTGGDELVNNLVNTLLSDNPPDNFDDFWKAVLPSEAQSEKGMIAMLDGFLGAYDAYDAFGETLGGDNKPPDGTNMGEVAQNAAVAFYLHSFAEANSVTTGEGLYDLLQGTTQPTNNEMPDPTNSTSFNNIINAAGLTDLFGSGA